MGNCGPLNRRGSPALSIKAHYAREKNQSKGDLPFHLVNRIEMRALQFKRLKTHCHLRQKVPEIFKLLLMPAVHSTIGRLSVLHLFGKGIALQLRESFIQFLGPLLSGKHSDDIKSP